MHVTSTSFQNIESIPLRYTGEGQDLSPALLWTDLPTQCASLAVLCEDPDSPFAPDQNHPFVHWILFNLAPHVGMLPEGIPHNWKISEPVACEQGLNSMGRPGYNGPLLSLAQGTHRFSFRLFALSEFLRLPPRPMRGDFLRGIEGHVLDSALLMGTFEKTKNLSAAS